MSTSTETITITADQAGCYLDNHRGHYIMRETTETEIRTTFIVGELVQFVLNEYDVHHSDDGYPHESLHELMQEAEDWLNSGQGSCDDCAGTGRSPKSGEWFKRADDGMLPDERILFCRKCSGTGRSPRIEFQNFPPIIPEGYSWGWNDGDFGLYADESKDD